MKLNHILFSAAACMALGSAALTSCSESFWTRTKLMHTIPIISRHKKVLMIW